MLSNKRLNVRLMINYIYIYIYCNLKIKREKRIFINLLNNGNESKKLKWCPVH